MSPRHLRCDWKVCDGDPLRVWLEAAREERDRAQVALQSGDPAPMKRWALEYGHLLVAKCEELAEKLEHALAHEMGDGRCKWCGHKDGHAPSCLVGGVEEALRVPGGGEDV